MFSLWKKSGAAGAGLSDSFLLDPQALSMVQSNGCWLMRA